MDIKDVLKLDRTYIQYLIHDWPFSPLMSLTFYVACLSDCYFIQDIADDLRACELESNTFDVADLVTMAIIAQPQLEEEFMHFIMTQSERLKL